MANFDDSHQFEAYICFVAFSSLLVSSVTEKLSWDMDFVRKTLFEARKVLFSGIEYSFYRWHQVTRSLIASK